MKKTFPRALAMSCIFLAVIAISMAVAEDGARKILRINGAGMASDLVDKWAKQFMAKTP
ncbi:MAG: hypothetical protein ACLP5H_23830 [Desulfomonilaceae bacterium]